MTIIAAFVQAFCDVIVAGFEARPLLWTFFAAFVFALMFAVWDGLERRGLRATAWGCASAAAFALWVAIA